MSESSSVFGQGLRDLRHLRQMTLEDVAAQAGVSIALLSRIERGERQPSPELIERLAQIYGVPAEDLLSDAVVSDLRKRWGASAASFLDEAEQAMPARGIVSDAACAFDGGGDEALHVPEPEPFDDAREKRLFMGPAPSRAHRGRSETRGRRSDVTPQYLSASLRPIDDLFGRATDEPSVDALADALTAAEASLRQLMREYGRASSSMTDEQREDALERIEQLQNGLDVLRAI